MASPPQSMEEVLLKLKENREFFADELAQDFLNFFVTEMYNAGYSLEENNTSLAVNLELVYEALKSTLYGIHGSEHPLQNIAYDLYATDQSQSDVDFPDETV